MAHTADGLPENIRVPLVGAQQAVENARRHLDGADVLAQEHMFGPAVSHLVLAVEEAGKAHLLTDEAHRRAIDPSIAADWAQLRRLISRHDFKQQVAEVLSWSFPQSYFMQELAGAGMIQPGAPLRTPAIEAMTKEGAPAGVVIGIRTPTAAAVGYVGVVPEQRGRGIATRLVRRSAERLLAAGATDIGGDCDRANLGMATAFTRAGFRQIARRRTFQGQASGLPPGQ